MPILETTDPEIHARSGIHVYQYYMSNCAQRVCLALEEKGLDWTSHSVNLFTQENTKDAYFKINPKGLVPSMIHDGVVITESMDILRYIEEQFPEPALYPSEPTQRQQVDKWMDLATDNHLGVVKTYMYSLAFGASKKPEQMAHYKTKQVDPALIAFHQQSLDGFSESNILAAERQIFAFFDSIEKDLGQHRWLVGDQYTYADIAWFVQYFLMQRVGMVNFENYPNIRRWASDFMQRPSFKHAVKALQPWYASLVCQVLRFKSRLKRGGPPPKQPRAVAS